MHIKKLQIWFIDALLILGHLATACMLFTLITSSSSHPVILYRYSVTLASTIVIILILLLTSGFILFWKRKEYREFLTTFIGKCGILPELISISLLFLTSFLLFVGNALTLLLCKPLFVCGLYCLLTSIVLGIPILMNRKRRRTYAGRIGGFFIGFFVSLILAELILRIVLPSSIFHPSLDLRPNIRLEIVNDTPGVTAISYHTTNSLGLRGEEPPENWDEYFTIITVGGSTTHCFYMDDQKTWPHHLQENLRAFIDNAWVGNGGLIGNSTRGHIVFMREVIPRLNPDMVIVLCGINDLGLSFKPHLLLKGLPWERASLGDWILASSRLVQVFSRWKQILFDDVTVITKNLPRQYCPVLLDSPEDQHPLDLRTRLPSLPEYESNIRTIIRQSRESNVKNVFLTQPLLMEDNEYWRNREGKSIYLGESAVVYSGATVWKMLDIFNTELMQICQEEGVPCFDLANSLGHEDVFFIDDMHFSEAGTCEVAILVSRFLQEENLVP